MRKESEMLNKLIFKKILKPLLIELFFFILYTFCIAMIPYMNKMLFDRGFSGGVRVVFHLGIIYLLLIAGSALFQYISQLFEWHTDRQFSLALKNRIFNQLYETRPYLYQTENAGEYVSYIDNNVPAIMEEYVEAIIDMIKSVFQIFIYGVILFIFIDYRIALIVLCSSSISIFVPKLTAKKIAWKRKYYLKTLGEYISKITDLFKGNSGLDAESKQAVQKYHGVILKKTEGSKFQWGKFKTLTNILNGFVMDWVSLVTFLGIGILYIRGEITIGDGVATFGYIESFIYPIKYILNDINAINSSSEVFKEIERFLFPKNKEVYEEINFQRIKNIEFKNVSVKRGSFELKNFSYVFKNDKAYALIGHSGSGKSTLLQLLSGKIKADSGRILINGIEVTDTMDLIAMKYFSIIEQDPYIFSQTFTDNVSNFGAYSMENVDDKIQELPQEMIIKIQNTDSVKLSGGEKQVLSLIKSSLSGKKVFLFDEVTSAIDIKNRAFVRTFIKQLDSSIRIEVIHDEDLREFDEIIEFDGGDSE